MLPPQQNFSQPILNTAPAIRWLLGACIAIHLVLAVLPESAVFEIVERFAFISARYTITGAWQLDPFSYGAAPLSHMFLHADMTHLLLNMAMLLAFGTAIARRMRIGPFLALYALCGGAGALFWALMHPYSIDPLLGASGAISGMVGAVAGIALGEPSGHGMPFRSRGAALVFVFAWVGLNFIVGLFGAAALGVDGAIAWEAHLGGFVAGFALVRLFPGSKNANPLV